MLAFQMTILSLREKDEGVKLYQKAVVSPGLDLSGRMKDGGGGAELGNTWEMLLTRLGDRLWGLKVDLDIGRLYGELCETGGALTGVM